MPLNVEQRKNAKSGSRLKDARSQLSRTHYINMLKRYTESQKNDEQNEIPK